MYQKNAEIQMRTTNGDKEIVSVSVKKMSSSNYEHFEFTNNVLVTSF